MRSVLEFSALALALLVTGCGKAADTGQRPDDDDSGGYSVDCEDAYNWTTVGAPFVYTWCTGCHSSHIESADTGWDPRQGAPDSVNLDSLEEVCGLISSIERRALNTPEDPMPPGGGPTEEELDALASWLACGPVECF